MDRVKTETRFVVVSTLGLAFAFLLRLQKLSRVNENLGWVSERPGSVSWNVYSVESFGQK